LRWFFFNTILLEATKNHIWWSHIVIYLKDKLVWHIDVYWNYNKYLWGIIGTNWNYTLSLEFVFLVPSFVKKSITPQWWNLHQHHVYSFEIIEAPHYSFMVLQPIDNVVNIYSLMVFKPLNNIVAIFKSMNDRESFCVGQNCNYSSSKSYMEERCLVQ